MPQNHQHPTQVRHPFRSGVPQWGAFPELVPHASGAAPVLLRDAAVLDGCRSSAHPLLRHWRRALAAARRTQPQRGESQPCQPAPRSQPSTSRHYGMKTTAGVRVLPISLVSPAHRFQILVRFVGPARRAPPWQQQGSSGAEL